MGTGAPCPGEPSHRSPCAAVTAAQDTGRWTMEHQGWLGTNPQVPPPAGGVSRRDSALAAPPAAPAWCMGARRPRRASAASAGVTAGVVPQPFLMAPSCGHLCTSRQPAVTVWSPKCTVSHGGLRGNEMQPSVIGSCRAAPSGTASGPALWRDGGHSALSAPRAEVTAGMKRICHLQSLVFDPA